LGGGRSALWTVSFSTRSTGPTRIQGEGFAPVLTRSLRFASGCGFRAGPGYRLALCSFASRRLQRADLLQPPPQRTIMSAHTYQPTNNTYNADVPSAPPETHLRAGERSTDACIKSYRASSQHGGVIADTPRKAALAFFDQFPSARKCSVIEGIADGHFFTVAYNSRPGKWPKSWKDVTRKTAATLPDADTQERPATCQQ
jgi:hypothetical protein